MPRFDYHTASHIMKRIESIPPDRKPEWGEMNFHQMLGHLVDVFEYCMGNRPPMPDKSTFYNRHIAAFLLFNRINELPRNVRLPRPKPKPTDLPVADIETFQAVLDEYLSKAQAGELDPPPHPYFGKMSIDKWAKFHLIHMDHHLRQFGA